MNGTAGPKADRPGKVRSCLCWKDHLAVVETLFRRPPSMPDVALCQRGTNQPSIAAIRLALPPAAVVSMQVTRSVANRAT